MPGPPSDDLRELLAHDGWIRRLCARLVSDPASADDLAQDAYLAAVELGPLRSVRSLRAWLASVVRNRWRDQRRSAQRRERRERTVARPEAMAGGDELSAEVELRRRLAEALLTLEEPLRRALVLRFFKDCTLEELARREQISLSSAHGRVERGLARLRSELDRSHGGRRAAWAALATRVASSAVAPTTEVILMGVTWKLLAAATAIALVSLLGWRVHRSLRASPDLAKAETGTVGNPSASVAVPEAVSVSSEERASLPEDLAAERQLALLLRRAVDGARLAFLPFEVEPSSGSQEGAWPMTDSDGRAQLTLPARARALRLEASGFEATELALAPEASELEVLLRPLQGLHGRVLWPDTRPAAGVSVTLRTLDGSLSNPDQITRSAREVYVSRRWRELARATTNERGEYFLALDSELLLAEAELRAGPAEGQLARRELSFPRPTGALEDLVLAPAARLFVRVLDTAGRPVVGAEVASREERVLGKSDAVGEFELLDPLLPNRLSARAPGFRMLACRVDGRELGPQDLVQSTEQRVELLLTSAPSAPVRVVDSETGFPLFLGHGRAQFWRGDRIVGGSTWQPDRHGVALVPLFSEEEPEPAVFDRVLVNFEREGYDESQLFEVDPTLTPENEPVVLAVDPLPGTRFLRGRVIRAGVGVPEVQVGLKAQLRLTGQGYQYHRAMTDAEGRFALRWLDEPGLSITVHPHWVRWDEFGFIGPLSAEQVGTEEHLLELEPALRVPVVVRGVEPGVTYLYYVQVLDELGGGVSTTINGAPLELYGEGDVRTTMLLPRQCSVRVSLGWRFDSYYVDSASPAVEHDPERSRGPLVFVVESPFARIDGRVQGVAPEERGELAVVFARRGESATKLVQVRSDGTFALPCLRKGSGRLLLIRSRPSELWGEVLACQELELDSDRPDLVLAPDPLTLPETPRR